MMRLFYCPTCTRVYCLRDDSSYLCGRNHDASVWADGKTRRFVISQRSDTNRPPWQIPVVVEEREMLQQELTECWLDECKFPEDTDFGDYKRHFGYGAFGGKHLSKDEVAAKYSAYLLKKVE
jgi:hypothetical protein